MSKAQLMIVEDNLVEAMGIQKCVENMGHSVVSQVASGEQAIRELESIHPDLIIMDITLQGEIDGIDVAERVSSRFHIPVIYLTGLSDDHIFERAKRTDPVGYLIKPFKECELQRMIALGLYRYRKEHPLAGEPRQIVKSPLMAGYDIDKIIRKRVEVLIREEKNT